MDNVIPKLQHVKEYQPYNSALKAINMTMNNMKDTTPKTEVRPTLRLITTHTSNPSLALGAKYSDMKMYGTPTHQTDFTKCGGNTLPTIDDIANKAKETNTRILFTSREAHFGDWWRGIAKQLDESGALAEYRYSWTTDQNTVIMQVIMKQVCQNPPLGHILYQDDQKLVDGGHVAGKWHFSSTSLAMCTDLCEKTPDCNFFMHYKAGQDCDMYRFMNRSESGHAVGNYTGGHKAYRYQKLPTTSTDVVARSTGIADVATCKRLCEDDAKCAFWNYFTDKSCQLLSDAKMIPRWNRNAVCGATERANTTTTTLPPFCNKYVSPGGFDIGVRKQLGEWYENNLYTYTKSFDECIAYWHESEHAGTFPMAENVFYRWTPSNRMCFVFRPTHKLEDIQINPENRSVLPAEYCFPLKVKTTGMVDVIGPTPHSAPSSITICKPFCNRYTTVKDGYVGIKSGQKFKEFLNVEASSFDECAKYWANKRHKKCQLLSVDFSLETVQYNPANDWQIKTKDVPGYDYCLPLNIKNSASPATGPIEYDPIDSCYPPTTTTTTTMTTTQTGETATDAPPTTNTESGETATDAPSTTNTESGETATDAPSTTITESDETATDAPPTTITESDETATDAPPTTNTESDETATDAPGTLLAGASAAGVLAVGLAVSFLAPSQSSDFHDIDDLDNLDETAILNDDEEM